MRPEFWLGLFYGVIAGALPMAVWMAWGASRRSEAYMWQTEAEAMASLDRIEAHVASMKADLTMNQERMLRAAVAAKSPPDVVTRPYHAGWEARVWDRNAKALCERGLLKPYVHGGYEITEDGRNVLRDESSGFSTWLAQPDGTGRPRRETFSPHEIWLSREAWNAALANGVSVPSPQTFSPAHADGKDERKC